MDEDLQRLTRELRKERCPPRVLEQVARQIAREPRTLGAWRFAAVGAVASAVLLAGLALWQWPSSREQARRSTPIPAAKSDSVRVVQEAGAALGYIGQILLEAGTHTQDVILKEAVPPLREGFETAKKTIQNRI